MLDCGAAGVKSPISRLRRAVHGGRHAAASEAYAPWFVAPAPRSLRAVGTCRTALVLDVPTDGEREAGIAWNGDASDELDRVGDAERRFVLP